MGGVLSDDSVLSKYINELMNEEALQAFSGSEKRHFSSLTQSLTESDAEYVITAIKHVFDSVIILQYEIHNTLEDQILSNVQVKISNAETTHNLKVKGTVPLNEDDQIKYNERRYVYVILDKSQATVTYPSLKISQKLTMKITEIDVESQEEFGSYEEEYSQLQDLVISTKDYVKSMVIPNGQYKDSWDTLGAQGQRDGTLSDMNQNFQLQFKTMNAAVDGVTKFFGNMSACEGTTKINVTDKVHNLLLSGVFFDQYQVLVRVQIGFNQEYGCVIKLTVRSLNAAVSQALLECIS